MKPCWDFGCAVKAAHSKLDSAEDLISRNEPGVARLLIHQADFNTEEAKLLKASSNDERQFEELRERRQGIFKRLPWHHRAIFRTTVDLSWLWEG